jgi:predicted site-specific integrase-resolvase
VEIAGVKLYTAQAIADTFGVNIVTILRHIKKGRLTAQLIGHKYYITEANLSYFLNQKRHKG